MLSLKYYSGNITLEILLWHGSFSIEFARFASDLIPPLPEHGDGTGPEPLALTNNRHRAKPLSTQRMERISTAPQKPGWVEPLPMRGAVEVLITLRQSIATRDA